MASSFICEVVKWLDVNDNEVASEPREKHQLQSLEIAELYLDFNSQC